jgi:hypothetical protein
MSFAERVRLQALAELKDQAFREAVENEKERLRTHRPLPHRIFPWKIVRR